MEKNSHPINDVLKPSNELKTPENTQQDIIRISINRIGNFKNFSLPFNAQIRLDWMNQRFESEKFSVETEGDVDLSFNVVIQSSISKNALHQQFLDNPVYIVVLGLPPSLTSTSKKSKRSTAGTKSAGKKRSAIPTETVIGGSCLDVLPILMGSDSLEKVLPLQSERQLFGSEIVSWPNLPYINLTVQPLLDFNSEEYSLPGNYMTIGLEAIYNMKCSSGSVVGGLALPIFQNNEAQHENFLYQSMKWVDRPNEGRKFKWANMVPSVEGCAANSEYEIFEDTGDISNVMDISENELQKIGIAPRLEWNRVHRCLLSPYCQQYVQNQIARYKTVPVEFMLTSDEMNLKLKNRSKETVDIHKEHLVAYADLSRLMFPGVASIRLVTQIHTFTKNNFVERSGDRSASIFETKVAKEPLLPRPGKDASHKKSKGKPSSKAATASSKTTEAEEVIPEEESVPLQTKDGLPVFVVMQISLHKPLIPKKTEDEFIFDLQSLIPKRVEKPINIKNAEKAYNDYCSAIKEAHKIIAEFYRVNTYNF
ncbi:cilia- and flagella-associated protein 70-like [Nilaparvata lugens]|uniref:cilia- and flagella-associated protein 70-like n=1 Tax=Nilaparvata lugens TaxID=108931 RepID=UPI00193D1196|nr:cilia- and flagella-associated protein 70-like [Nilaparvata lugens]